MSRGQGPELDLIGAVDPLAGELLDETRGILVGVDRDRGALLALWSRAASGADVDPDAHGAGEIATNSAGSSSSAMPRRNRFLPRTEAVGQDAPCVLVGLDGC